MKTKFVLFIAVLFTGMYLQAQTVDEVVNKYIEAMGGKEKLASLKTVKMTGNISTQGMEIPIVMTKSHLTGIRVEFEVMGNSNYQTANVEQGWEFMPVMGMTTPQEMDAEKLASFGSQMDVHGSLFNYKEKGVTLGLMGSEKVDGADAYKIKAINKTKTILYFIDKKTNRIIKTSTMAKEGEENESATTFSDYKQNADGFWFPYTVANVQGPITFEKIETNLTIDPKTFTN